MSKMPSQLLKRLPFDNPFKPTAAPALEQDIAVDPLLVKGDDAQSSATAAVDDAARAEALVSSVAGAKVGGRDRTRKRPAAAVALVPRVGDDAYPYRLTARFTESQWKLLQDECHRRRMAGQRMNVAELLRALVNDWSGSGR